MAGIVCDVRNLKVAKGLQNGPDADIVLLFGAGHGPGIFADLQVLDPSWRRTR